MTKKQSELAKKIERWIDRTNRSEKAITEKQLNEFMYLCEKLDNVTKA